MTYSTFWGIGFIYVLAVIVAIALSGQGSFLFGVASGMMLSMTIREVMAARRREAQS